MRLFWRILLSLLTTFGVFAGWSSGDILPVHDFDAYQDGAYGDPPQQTFRSSNITAPVLNYGTWRKDLIAGDESSHIFLTLGYEASGPYVFRDADLSLVYADPSFDYAMNARVQTINGTKFLTFWHGVRNRGDSQGFCVFYDQHYRLVYNVTLGPPFSVDADMHECEVTPDGTLLLTAYQDKKFDLSPLGGKADDLMADGCFQELRVETGEALFSWCASDWFDVGLGQWNLSGPISKRGDSGRVYATSEGFDVYHINSLQKTKEGHYFVSLRNLWLLTYINGMTGKPIWTLGGKHDDFIDITPEPILQANPQSAATFFSWQHHAKVLDDEITQITLFDNRQLDNAIGCVGLRCSRGSHFQINTTDPDHLTKELVNQYWSPHGLSSVIFGSMQALPDTSNPDESDRGSFLLGWGVSPEFTEHTSEGELVRDVQYSRLDPEHSFAGTGSVSSYRVFKQSWHGYPTWPPAVGISDDGSLWVSWNGAAEVRSWAVYGSHKAEALGPESGSWRADKDFSLTVTLLRTVPRQGFETEIKAGGRMASYVKVAALNADEKIIGTSQTLETGWVPSISSCLLQDTMSFTCLIRLLV